MNERNPTADARLRAVYEAMACGVIVRNATGDIVYAKTFAEHKANIAKYGPK